jgi:Galactose oxidase, central domain/Kelch motif
VNRRRVVVVATVLLMSGCTPTPSATPSPTTGPSSAAIATPSTTVAPTAVPSPVAGSGSWTATGPLHEPRGNQTATLLNDGRVLVVGGQADRHGAPLASAEIYDPATRTWTPTASMATARYVHTATLLPNGEVLVAGGLTASGDSLSSAELFDPTTGTWHATAPMHSGHTAHTATLLNTGEVLVAGGSPDPAELYDPKAGRWSLTGGLPRILDGATSTLLADGNVELTGGAGHDPDGPLASTEIYDARAGTWSFGQDLRVKRENHAATTLLDTKVLITGGFDGAAGALDSAELSDPADGSWVQLDRMHAARLGHTATLLPNGLVLVAGGQLGPGNASIASAELYDSGRYPGPSWIVAASMTTERDGHTATLLQDGDVLVAGGFGSTSSGGSAETYRAAPRPLPDSGRMDDGTYLTPFEPAFSITNRIRGGVDAALPAFVDIEFGFDPLEAHGGGTWSAEISAVRIDQVTDPTSGALVAPPTDIVAWIEHLPGVTVVDGPTKMTIGGRPATRVELLAGSTDVTFGPIAGISDFGAGFGAGQHRLFYVLDVGGHEVLITIGLVNLEDPAKLERAIEALEPSVRTITWN